MTHIYLPNLKNLQLQLFSICLLLMPLASFADSEHWFVASGVLEADAQLVEDFTQYLSEQSGYPMKVFFAKDYSGLSDMLRKNPEAVAWTCGSPYVEDQKADGQQLIAVPLFENEPTYHSMVISLRGRPEKKLRDFNGQVLAYSDLRSNSGYVAPHHHLKLQEVNTDLFFKIKINAHNHVGSIEAVLGGLADVAAVDEYVLVEFQRKNPEAAKELQILEKLGPFPFTPIVAGNKVKQSILDKLQHTLLTMSTTRQGRDLLIRFGLDGFVAKDTSFFRPIEEMLVRLGKQVE